MKVMGVMATTTIPISKEFHDWLKGKGMKGESYEDVIKKLLAPEHKEEVESLSGSSDETEFA
jgi:predicted CopG family antitoxin